MVRAGALVATLLLVATSIGAAKLERIESQRDFEEFSDLYYLDPKPELVGQAIEFLAKSDLTSNEGAVPPLIAFFAEVFEQNPGRMAEWSSLIQRQDDATRRLLEAADALNPREGIAELPPSAHRNDMCWAAFGASGRTEYVDLVVDALAHLEQRKDVQLYLVGASAKWSLASNVRIDPAVKQYIESRHDKASGAEEQALGQVLTMSPEAIREETVATIKRRRESGDW